MQNLRKTAVLTVLVTFFCLTGQSRAMMEVLPNLNVNVVADFYQPLAPLGVWVDVPGYGRCWHPNVDRDWRPYCEGEWVWTDSGWYWDSDEPWSWACYHYGSWAPDPSFGWVWIPDVEWAPAWVSWRVGGGHIGWAPLEPRGRVPAAGFFAFVDEHRFGDRIRRGDVVINNTKIIKNTSVINDIRREDRDFGGRRQTIVINQGPKVEDVQRATGHSIERRPIQEVAQHNRGPGGPARQGANSFEARPAPQLRETVRTIQPQPPENRPFEMNGRDSRVQPQENVRNQQQPQENRSFEMNGRDTRVQSQENLRNQQQESIPNQSQERFNGKSVAQPEPQRQVQERPTRNQFENVSPQTASPAQNTRLRETYSEPAQTAQPAPSNTRRYDNTHRGPARVITTPAPKTPPSQNEGRPRDDSENKGTENKGNERRDKGGP